MLCYGYSKYALNTLMASLDKTSLRTEVSRLKTDFEQLWAEGKITSESKGQSAIYGTQLT